MLIRNAEVWGKGRCDVRVDGERIGETGILHPRDGETVVDAEGGALLPGLHDHHIHLAGLAARKSSIPCGPPEVTDAQGLALALNRPGSGWIRGVGYHESLLGGSLPDAVALDGFVAHRPLRLQHRTGRMWLLNTMALDDLLARATPPPGLERLNGRFTGRLFDEDDWLRRALRGTPPDLGYVSRELAGFGVTGATDMSPRNDPAMAAHFARQRAEGTLAQSLVLAGALALDQAEQAGWRLGPLKLHLHEAALPDFDKAAAFVRAGHAQGRPLAVHCVTEVELVFTLALLEECGPLPGDRIEHVSVAAPDLVARMAALGLQACIQPHFIAERGDSYLAEVEPRHHGDLYRLRSLHEAGMALAGGSDAPYGSPDPWTAMAAAVHRRTASGAIIGPDEALTPEEALALYLADPLDLARQRRIAPGETADLCLLDRPWTQARERLSCADVVTTWTSGRCIHKRVDQSPV
ncbi:amidohydrolase family protein [Novosphingobium mangrovi (ex Huang et al. 2023)]|uniref:Amidohydrolase family protein n=1 Tax=Novosphingobium mangrovi (ex Huang et al. 2023) TaxID=2976432 RepID=A0ABT2I7L2_9SPHN|nr:amidohydrolase family protein [Novosphingobium mangrovi (ex Huang et al. 2023)]MCT2400805.1 amidohydrolase family protein [Novosphingobium mangrovi (ex Huang et al. 2023)]